MESCLPSEEDVLIIRPPGTKGHFASKPQFTSISRGLPGKRLGFPDKMRSASGPSGMPQVQQEYAFATLLIPKGARS